MMEFNAILTGSTKYGERRALSDIDVAVWVPKNVLHALWAKHEGKRRIMYDQVKFIHANDEFVTCFANDDSDGVDIYCRMSDDDRDTLAGLHKHVRIPGRSRTYKSTGRNDDVNIIPVCDPDLWSIWIEGTAALYESRLVDEPATRDEAIEFFTVLGMPRDGSGSGGND